MIEKDVTLAEVAEKIGAEIRFGRHFSSENSNVKETILQQPLSGIASPDTATSSHISFIAQAKYAQHLQTTKALAVIVNETLAENYAGVSIIHSNPYLAYAEITALFAPKLDASGIHPSVVIAEGVYIGDQVSIGANTVIEPGVSIGEGSVIGPNCYIGKASQLGKDSKLYPNVTIYHDVTIGSRAIIHSGTVIGSDGFGFAPTASGWTKIHQLGGVRIGDDVEIGASCTIDRGALSDTLIGNHVKMDNQVMIAHNVEVGDASALAGQSGIAGSSRVGKRFILAGQAGLVGHINVCDGVTVTAKGMITRSIDEPGSYSSGTGFTKTQEWRKNAVSFNKLSELTKRVRALEIFNKKEA